jgi:hypothetical protein
MGVMSMPRCKKLGYRVPILIVVVFMFLANLFTQTTHGKEESFKRLSLRGLKEVDIEVEALNPEAEKDGLVREDLLSDIESELGQAGITVTTGEAPATVMRRPYLYVNITLIKTKRLFFLPSSYSIYLGVSLYQNVLLERKPSQKIVAITWQEGSIGGCKAKVLKSHVREKLRELVDKFISDYSAENPQ